MTSSNSSELIWTAPCSGLKIGVHLSSHPNAALAEPQGRSASWVHASDRVTLQPQRRRRIEFASQGFKETCQIRKIDFRSLLVPATAVAATPKEQREMSLFAWQITIELIVSIRVV